VTGYTKSEDYPITSGCYDNTLNGTEDAFVFKLNKDGSDLLYSTFVGGNSADCSYSITLDTERNAHITGRTYSTDFPTTSGCLDNSYNGGNTDIFVCKLNADGSSLIFSTFVGGDKDEMAKDITFDSERNALILGTTSSSDFPITPGCYDDSHNGDDDVFVFKLSKDGSDLLYSTFVGGSGYDDGNSIAFNSKGNAYVTGRTKSSDFPITPGCYDESHNQDWDVFVLNLNFTVKLTAIIDSISPNPAVIGEGPPLKGKVAGYWSLDEGSGNKIHDASKNRKDGTIYNATWADGRFGKALRFDGVDDLERINSITLFENAVSIGAWIKHETVSSNIQRYVNCADNVVLRHDGEDNIGQLDFYIRRTDSSYVHLRVNDFLEVNTWYFVVGTWDGTTMKLYANGELLKSSSPGGTMIHGNTYLRMSHDKEHMHGIIDEILLYNRALSKDEIQRHYENNFDLDIEFLGRGVDREPIARYSWCSSIDGEVYNDSESSFATNAHNLSAGEHTIYLKVQNNQGVWSKEVNTSLVVTKRPIALIKSISPNPVLTNDSIQFNGTGTDDGTIKRYVWTSSIDGEIYNGTEAEFTLSNLSLGQHTIYLMIQDNHHVWSQIVQTSLLVFHERAIATIDSISPNPAVEGVEVWFYGNGTDKDGEIKEYFWASNLDGVLSAHKSFNCSNLSTGVHIIGFRVKSDDGYWSDSVSQELEILNAIPEALIDTITPPKALETDTITFGGHGTDYNGTIEDYLWESNIDGVIGTTDSFSRTLSPGLHNITFKVRDNAGAWSHPDVRKIWVNDIPEAFIKPGHPRTVNESENLTLEGSGEDLGEIQGYEWKSNIDGIIGNEATLKVSNLSIESHNITLRVMDNETIWSENVSVEIKINDFPVVMAGDDIHSFPHVEVQFNGEGTDSDGEIVKYEWDFNGNGIYDWSSEENGLARFIYNNPGEYTAVLRVTDNDGAQSTDSLVVTVDMNVTGRAQHIVHRFI